MSNQPQQRRQSTRKSFGTSVSSSAAAAATANLSAMHLSTMYHTVLKLSSENKITAKNSWQLPLIDHMQSLIRGDMKGGAAGSGTGPTTTTKTSVGQQQKDITSSSVSTSTGGGKGVGNTIPSTTNGVISSSSTVSSKVFSASTNGGAKPTLSSNLSSAPSFTTRDPDTIDVALLNFQRASCTLDASVKIWSCRVDDVYTSSFRVLENLSRTGDQQIKEGEEDGSGALDRESNAVIGGGGRNINNDDNDEDEEGSGKTRSKQSAAARARASATIETNLANITAKRIDASVEVDPMYARLSGGGGSSDTGEGAAGMLLCRLSVHIGCELAFDSSEVGDIDALTGSGFLSSSHRMFPSESAALIEALPISALSDKDNEEDREEEEVIKATSNGDASPFLRSLKSAELAKSIEEFHSSMRTHASMINDITTLSLLPPPPNQHSKVDYRPQSRLSLGGTLASSSSSSSSGLFIGAVRNNVITSSASAVASIAVAAAASAGTGNGGAWAAVARIAEGIETANNVAESIKSSSSITSVVSSTSPSSSSISSSAIVESSALAAIDDALDAAKQQEAEAALQSAVVSSNTVNDDDNDNDQGASFGEIDHGTWPSGGGNDDDDDDTNDDTIAHETGAGGTSSSSSSSYNTSTKDGTIDSSTLPSTASLGIAAGPAASGAAAEYTFVDLAALTTAVGGTGSSSTSSHWRFKANARKAAEDVKQRAIAAIEKTKGINSTTTATTVSLVGKGKGNKGKKTTTSTKTATETKRALAAKGGLDFTLENNISSDAFTKGKVPLASSKSATAAKVGNIIGMAPTQRDAEQLQPAAVEKLTSKGNRANSLPLIPGGSTLGATLIGGSCPVTLKSLGPKALLSNMHLFLRPSVILPVSTGIDETDPLTRHMERGLGAAGEILFPSARAAAARAALAANTSTIGTGIGVGETTSKTISSTNDNDDEEDAGGGYWPSGGGNDDYDDPEYSGGGGGGGGGGAASSASFTTPAFVGNASSPMKTILAAVATEESSATAATTVTSIDTVSGGNTTLSTGPVELIAAGRQVEKIRVKYATVANRVDVHALKDDMRALLLNGALRKTTHKAFENELKAKALEHERSFTDVSTSSLTKSSSTLKSSSSSSSLLPTPSGMRFAEHVIKPMVPSMSKEVSVSFYLITLLHLCNDHNLVLSREDLKDFEILSLEERGPVKGL
jgi:hypothetical protein